MLGLGVWFFIHKNFLLMILFDNGEAQAMKKKALVTGGLGGIGTAICRDLQRAGYVVATTYIHNGPRLEKWAAAQTAAGYEKFFAYLCDVSRWEDCVRLKEAVEGDLGGVDVVVNNAGIARDAMCRKMSAEMWDEVIVTNLSSVFYVTRQFLDGMIERQFGRIINVASVNGLKGQFGQVNYSAAKAGMLGFAKALAQETVRKGITVNCVSPGYVDTEMVMTMTENMREQIRAQIPVGRFGTPEEIARLVTFLASDDSGFITGANFSANGGQYMSF